MHLLALGDRPAYASGRTLEYAEATHYPECRMGSTAWFGSTRIRRPAEKMGARKKGATWVSDMMGVSGWCGGYAGCCYCFDRGEPKRTDIRLIGKREEAERGH